METFRTPGIVGPQMFFANPLLLFGLAAVLVPLAIHFLSRRRYDEVGWGAMRFLRLTPKARRRVFLDQWLLLVVRVAALALLALALAGPTVRSSFFNRFETTTPRTTVVLIDVSGSTAGHGGAARDWVEKFIDQMRPGDRVALFGVKGDVVPLLPTPTADPEPARAALELLPRARGSADWPAAVEFAARAFEAAEILVVTDGQRFGWADDNALARWDVLAKKAPLPRVWVANVAAERVEGAPRITTFRAPRTVATAGSEVRFEGTAERVPSLKITVDGRASGEIAVGRAGVFSFARKLPLGSHLVAVSAEGVTREVAVDVVPPHGVLLVTPDGAPVPLAHALSPPNDPTPAFTTRVVSAARFAPGEITQNTRVVILSGLPALTAEQGAAVESFASNGGGVLVALGDQTQPAAWNRVGRGWLPATVGEPVVGADARMRAGSDHPALRLFRDPLPGGLHTATFPRYWKLAPESGAAVSLTNDDALLAEERVGRGRVVVCAAPLDASGESNLIRLPDFVPFVHELTHHLAGGGWSPANVLPGEPIVFRPRDGEPPGSMTVVPPDGPARTLPVKAWPATFDGTRDPGPYRVVAGGTVRHYVVHADPRESDLTPPSEAERDRLARIVGALEEVRSPAALSARRGRGPKSVEFGDALLVLVLGLFAAELWCARRTAGA